jgi:PAS domain S-box-containing protein
MPDKDKILVVDDDHRMCASLKDLLASQHYEIKTSCSGYEALAFLSEEMFDLVLLDIVMKEMDGFQVMEKMTLNHLNIPVIIVTGHASTESAVTALRKGAYDYLKKPVEPETLFASIKHTLTRTKLQKKSCPKKRNPLDNDDSYRTFFNQAVDCIFVVEPDHDGEDPVISEVNEAACITYGYTSDEFIGKPFSSISAENERHYLPEKLQQLRSGKPQIFKSNHIQKAGIIFPVEVSARMIHIGAKPFIFSIVRSISDRKRTEEETKVSSERLLAILNGLAAIVYVADIKSGELLFVNNYVKDVFGDCIGQPCWKVLQAGQLGRCAFCNNDKLMDAGGNPAGIYCWDFQNTLNGRWYDARDRALKWTNGRMVRMEIATDITHRKQAENERLRFEKHRYQHQKSESLKRMAGAIAHLFNNQLMAIMGNLELGMEDLCQGVSPSKKLAEAMKAACKASHVSGMMLTYLGKSNDPFEPFDIYESCRRNILLLRATLPETIPLEADFPVGSPIIHADSDQIHQVLIHLLTNAGESIADGHGSVHLKGKTVFTENIPESHRYPIDWNPSNTAYVCLEIADTGCGIIEKDIEKIFDPFFTNKFTGRGLGLPVVLGILRAHRGGITVESKPGKGSIFRVFLPVSPEP